MPDPTPGAGPMTRTDARERVEAIAKAVDQYGVVRMHLELEDQNALVEAIEALALPSASAPAVTGWQPIETAPKDNRDRLHYVIITDGVSMPDVAIWENARPAFTDRDGTHWCERPAGWFNVIRSRVRTPTLWMPCHPSEPPMASPGPSPACAGHCQGLRMTPDAQCEACMPAALPAPARPTAEQIECLETLLATLADSEGGYAAQQYRALEVLLTAVTGKDTTP